jgi:two-component system, LytTR family, response regulator LytT
MIRTLIIEDEVAAAQRLERMLQRIEPAINTLAILDSIRSTVEWFRVNPPPDLLMLDIQLGDGLSFEIFRKVQVDCFVIFTTAYDEYAIKAFELNSIDYLLKPVDEQKLRQSIEKFKKLRTGTPVPDMEKLLKLVESRQERFKKRFVVSVADKIRLVETKDALFFYALEKSTFLCTSGNIHYPVDFSLDQLETLLDTEQFFRVNRQYIISYAAISKISILPKSRIGLETTPPVEGGIVVSSARSHEFRKWLDR